MKNLLNDLGKRIPELLPLLGEVKTAADLIISAFEADKILFLCGNGGSAADCEHIAGELLKSFKAGREPVPAMKAELNEFGQEGTYLADKLECGLRAISLTSHPSFSTAFGNDVDGQLVFAQQLFALGRPGDVLLGISTSGNAGNIRKCFITAKAKGIKTILLTGKSGGICAQYADCIIGVPETETYLIQEKHVCIYHCLCLLIEDHFYGEK
ncbi:MAG: SIS domain-containing protein [Victivallales bacterium]|nr:SIS domain-containing protein [Victivallales bacterium]